MTGRLPRGFTLIELLVVMVIIGTLLTEYEMEATTFRIRLDEGVAMGLLLSILAVTLVVRLRRQEQVDLG